MGKGAATRQVIVERAAAVFNQRGYWGASLQDLMEATGLQKGGIYNHFGSKEALALEAFEHNTGVVRSMLADALAPHRHAADRLHAVVDVFRRIVESPPFPGGCPIQNTAIESDDTHPALRDRARATAAELVDGTLARIVERGVERGELDPATDPHEVATVVMAALEGAIMLSRLQGSPAAMGTTADHLGRWIDSLRRTP